VRQIAIEHFGIDALAGHAIRHAFRRLECDFVHDPRMYVPQVRLALHGRYRFLNGKLKTTCLELPAERLRAAG
jgi:hypothetical protein